MAVIPRTKWKGRPALPHAAQKRRAEPQRIRDTFGLQDALDAKANSADLGTAAASDASDFAAASHTHTASQITDFEDAVTAIIGV